MAFLPPDFEVPELLETDRFRIRPLTIHDVVKDYDSVMRPDERAQLGCVSIAPSHKQGFDAAAALWVRASEVAGDLDEALYATVRRWLADRRRAVGGVG